MADPFEIRLSFSKKLRELCPVADNYDDAVNFAMKYRSLDEDLHSCILEQLEDTDNNVNVRANIIYFLEDLVRVAKRYRYYSYVCMVERDFPRMINLAMPKEGLGVINAKCVEYIMDSLHFKFEVFWDDDNSREAHNKTIGQTAQTKSYSQLKSQLLRRVQEVQPTIRRKEPAKDMDELDPDDSWKTPGELVANMEVEASVTSKNDKLHDIPSPTGSASPLPQTPRSPTPQSPLSNELESDSSVFTFTPVQKTDPKIFSPKYFEFMHQRIEQDRERQRRKEDNQGFMQKAGNSAEEIQQIANTGKGYIGDVFQSMKAEQSAWQLATKYD